MKRLKLEKDQPVVVQSQVGSISGFLARAYPEIKPGNVLMYFPEANELVPRDLDPQSRTPAFKAVAVTICPASTGQSAELPLASAIQE